MNRLAALGVLLVSNEAMPEYAERLPAGLLGVASEIDGEFQALLVESSRLAFRVALSVLRNREDAEDVSQEAFIRAYRRFNRLRDRRMFRAWLVRITWRLAIDRCRADSRRLHRESEHVEETMPPSPDDPLAVRERAEMLWRAIDRLPEKLRIVIVLANIEEHDLGEVARLLKLPPGTVKSRLFLARRRLKEALQ